MLLVSAEGAGHQKATCQQWVALAAAENRWLMLWRAAGAGACFFFALGSEPPASTYLVHVCVTEEAER